MVKVLIAEDNFMIADLVEEFLAQNNYEICAVTATGEESMTLAKLHKPDIIILDQRLAGYDLGTDVAARLTTSPSIAILYVTANSANVMEIATNGHACLGKPYRLDDLLRSIEIVMEMVATGTASPPFPRGFKVLPSAVSAAHA